MQTQAKPTLVNGVIPVTNISGLRRCKGCNVTIKWGTTAEGRKMPFELDLRNTAHWATCAAAEQFR